MPSVFEIERSTFGVTLSVSLAELFVPFVSVNPAGAAMVAVLSNDKVPAGVVGSTVTFKV